MREDKLGDFKMFNCPSGWYVSQLCPLNTSNPSADNAFWFQVSKYYKYKKYALRILAKKTLK